MLLLAFIFLCAGIASGRECNLDYETACDDGQCVNLHQWCNGKYDCADGSDENYCFESTDPHVLQPEVSYYEPRQNKLSSNITQAVVNAVNFLLNKTQETETKRASMFRAAIALSFVKNVRPLNESEKELVKKRLNIEMTLTLMQDVKKLTLTQLALCVNALLAVCEDPRNFHGMDLVKMLRNRSDDALKSTSDIPFALLTLCVAGEYKSDDMPAMDAIYKRAGNRIGVQALALLALICSDHRTGRSDSRNHVTDFSRLRGLETTSVDVYTKSLYLQASNAASIRNNPEVLLIDQLLDGSFGDVLATYQAIPALLGTNLLELKCDDSNKQGLSDCTTSDSDNGLHITYSISLTSDTDKNVHSMVIESGGCKTFYEIMKRAANRDPTFRFMADETHSGKKLYSIAGTPNDPESGLFWTLYRGDSRLDANSINTEETRGLDSIVPTPNEHFIFRMQRKSK